MSAAAAAGVSAMPVMSGIPPQETGLYGNASMQTAANAATGAASGRSGRTRLVSAKVPSDSPSTATTMMKAFNVRAMSFPDASDASAAVAWTPSG
jgi:hypothetical protein